MTSPPRQDVRPLITYYERQNGRNGKRTGVRRRDHAQLERTKEDCPEEVVFEPDFGGLILCTLKARETQR